MDPINYAIDVKSPIDSVLKGYQAGTALRQQQQQEAVQQQQLMAQRQMQQDLNQLSLNPDAGAKEYAAVMTRYPQLAEQLKNPMAAMSDAQKQNNINQMAQLYSAVQGGNTDAALKLLDTQQQAYANSGDQQKAQQASAFANTIRANPTGARTALAMQLAASMGTDKFAEAFSAINKAPVEAQKLGAEALQKQYEAMDTPQRLQLEANKIRGETQNLDSQIADRTNQLGLERDKLQSNTELELYKLQASQNPALNLSQAARDKIDTFSENAQKSEESANKLDRLAQDFVQNGGGFGAFGTAAEWFANKVGGQDKMSAMRSEYDKLVNSEVIKGLPPGSASNKDVEIFRKGFPLATSDAQYLAAWLRGAAKVNHYAALQDNARSAWMQDVGHLGKARKDIDIYGVKVPAGVDFNEFAKTYLPKAQAKMEAQNKQKTISSRSYYQNYQNYGSGQ